jgi:hypothetical protein
MDLRQHVESVVQDVCKVVPTSLDAEQTGKISEIVERALVEVMRELAKHHSGAAQECCPPDQDLAHKIATEISQKNDALIANLTGLR